MRKGIATPICHIPVPEGPFKHLVMDYVDMIKRAQANRYMLVIIDISSRWVEVTPSADQGAVTVIQFLTREVIPRFGIPSEISSDNGSPFIQKNCKTGTASINNKAKTRVYVPSSITRGSREIEWNHQGQTEQNM